MILTMSCRMMQVSGMFLYLHMSVDSDLTGPVFEEVQTGRVFLKARVRSLWRMQKQLPTPHLGQLCIRSLCQRTERMVQGQFPSLPRSQIHHPHVGPILCETVVRNRGTWRWRILAKKHESSQRLCSIMLRSRTKPALRVHMETDRPTASRCPRVVTLGRTLFNYHPFKRAP